MNDFPEIDLPGRMFCHTLVVAAIQKTACHKRSDNQWSNIAGVFHRAPFMRKGICWPSEESDSLLAGQEVAGR
jgi:hypothetical protein